MKYHILTHKDLKHSDLSKLTDIIYNNFIELKEDYKLMHTKEKISETLHSDDVLIIIALNEQKKIVGFIVSQLMELDDRRKVLFINYIYVAESLRKTGMGSEMMDMLEREGYKYKCNGIMLIFDTYNAVLVRFYENRGYMLDINLRRYERHDVFYKTI
jgi:ribosomal protein S18 acetylase RimI-like enzyme